MRLTFYRPVATSWRWLFVALGVTLADWAAKGVVVLASGGRDHMSAVVQGTAQAAAICPARWAEIYAPLWMGVSSTVHTAHPETRPLWITLVITIFKIGAILWMSESILRSRWRAEWTRRLAVLGTACIAGGWLGNTAETLTFHGVIDWLAAALAPWVTGSSATCANPGILTNIADLAIVGGFVLVAAALVGDWRHHRNAAV